MKGDPLELVASNLWQKLGFQWNKTKKPTPHGINSWQVYIHLPKGSLKCKEEPELGEHEAYEGPVELCYEESYHGDTIFLTVKSTYDGFHPENKAKGRLHYGIPSASYAELVERIKRAGPIGEKLLQQQRIGNPDVARFASWDLQLDNLEGLEEFLLSFINYQAAHSQK